MSEAKHTPVSERQEFIDRFYFRHGPCCAGCDWWRHINSLVGECLKSAPTAGQDRGLMLGTDKWSMRLPAGHMLTPRQHHCGDFKDGFDWSLLPLAYRKRVGDPKATGASPK